MSKLGDYINKNKAFAYQTARENTPKNASGKTIITKDDEWREEKEWENK